MLRYLLTLLFAVVLTAPAYADGLYVEAKATVNAESLADYEDTISGAGAIGYDFGQYRLAAEYYAGRGESLDAVIAMAYVDFGDRFQVELGLGGGVSIDEFQIKDIDKGDILAQGAAGVSYGFTDQIRGVAEYAYQTPVENLGNGTHLIMLGARYTF